MSYVGGLVGYAEHSTIKNSYARVSMNTNGTYIGGLVGSGASFEKVFLLYNPMTYETADIISTFVFRLGLGSGNYIYSTAVNLIESFLNLGLLTIANKVSKKITGSGLW